MERNSNVAIIKICYTGNGSIDSFFFTFPEVYISVIHKGRYLVMDKEIGHHTFGYHVYFITSSIRI